MQPIGARRGPRQALGQIDPNTMQLKDQGISLQELEALLLQDTPPPSPWQEETTNDAEMGDMEDVDNILQDLEEDPDVILRELQEMMVDDIVQSSSELPSLRPISVSRQP